MCRDQRRPAEGLRVALMHWAMPPTTGGVESHVADLARALAGLGCLVTVLTGENEPAPIPGVEMMYLPGLDLGLLRGDGTFWSREEELKKSLRKVVSEQGLQVIHGHNLHHFFPTPALVLDELKDEMGFQLHHTFHETWPDVLHRRPVYHNWRNYAVSRFVQSECLRRIGFSPLLTPLGIDTDRFKPQRLQEKGKPFVILHPARVLPWKGVHVSVEMLAELRRRGLEVKLIITDTQKIVDWNDELVSYRKEIVRRLDSEGVADLVEFRSAPYHDMHQLYEESDVVVYPTIGDEPYGLVPLEAMSMTRPVIGARSGGISETIVEGVTGFLVERGDAVGLADLVQQLLLDPELCRQMGQAGRRHVIANFNGRKYAADLVESYLLSLSSR